MKKRLSFSLLCSLISLSVYAEQIQSKNETGVIFTTINAKEAAKAEHWGVSHQEWRHYLDYMEVEGKYFYEKLDPLNVLGLITDDPELRKKYIVSQLNFERKKIGKETSYANDAWRIQQELYGEEKLMDFSSLPWMDDQKWDNRTIKQTIKHSDVPAQNFTAPSLSHLSTIEFKPDDELWVLMDNECQNCEAQIQTLMNDQPLKVAFITLIREPKELENWAREANINEYLQDEKARLEIFDPLMFEDSFIPSVNTIWHARNGHVIRQIQ